MGDFIQLTAQSRAFKPTDRPEFTNGTGHLTGKRSGTEKSQREPHLQNSQDDAADEKYEKELPAADGGRFGEGGDEEGQRPDEGDGCHGDHGSLCRVGRDLGAVAAAVAAVSSVAASVSRAVAADSPVAAAVAAAVPAAVPAHAILHVPHEGGGHAGKYADAQEERSGQHGLDDARRRQPFVEVLGFVLHVVGPRRRRISVVVALSTLEAARGAKAIVGLRGQRGAVDRRTVVAVLVEHFSTILELEKEGREKQTNTATTKAIRTNKESQLRQERKEELGSVYSFTDMARATWSWLGVAILRTDFKGSKIYEGISQAVFVQLPPVSQFEELRPLKKAELAGMRHEDNLVSQVNRKSAVHREAINQLINWN